ncbi:MAG TPA: hypothetical protein PLG67_03170 [Bacillota bacterium]|nr:hypothetical protein [Bacillota bacterium]HRS22329.1 hypothetical protein [Clostridia bacterium]HRU41456.1 hypothetical protein [Candidatus Diapherotrites archaeon]HOS70720.1 hypothetical protein [Bacillota bacterium]HQE65272.1 hypothetical protein [Bacillota bacterium]
MFNKRILFFCTGLALLAAALQAVPPILGAAFGFAALLNGFPIYLAARLSYILGILVYLSAAALLAFYNPCEALFFICTNGIIGLSLGIIKDRFRSIYPIPALSAILDIAILLIVNYRFGISIFSPSAFSTPVSQAAALMLPMYLYCLIYLKLAMSVDKLLHRYIELDIHP